MKKLIAVLTLAALTATALLPVMAGYYDRAPLYEQCFKYFDRYGNPVYELKTVGCYPDPTKQCLPLSCAKAPIPL